MHASKLSFDIFWDISWWKFLLSWNSVLALEQMETIISAVTTDKVGVWEFYDSGAWIPFEKYILLVHKKIYQTKSVIYKNICTYSYMYVWRKYICSCVFHYVTTFSSQQFLVIQFPFEHFFCQQKMR